MSEATPRDPAGGDSDRRSTPAADRGDAKRRDGAVRRRQRTPSRLASALEIAWLLLLLLPAATTLSAAHDWDIDQHALFSVSCWLIVAARLLWPRRGFFPSTLPVALVGALLMGADFLRNADLLELLLQWRTYSASDIESALRPYAWHVGLAFTALATLCWAGWRFTPDRTPTRALRIGILALTAALAALVPATTWLRAWPVDAVLVAASAASNSRVLAQYLFPAASLVNPRAPQASWHGRRAAGAEPAETVVFVIGESIRNDYLQECHGPERVRRVADGALVACDVTAGSDSTHTSVPLLVSRELPGHAVRVSNDATFMQALKEAGFATYWFGVQGATVAWSEADDQRFPAQSGDDAKLLGPLLRDALSTPPRLKAITLHAYNAHESYCARYDRASAPYAASCPTTVGEADRSHIANVRLAYANAVDASIGFINSVIAELDKHPEPAFLIFSPDHGENLLDDERQLYGHARRHPTRWDTHVPAIFWANVAWRSTHAAQWARLAAQVDAPLMHADLVPTLLDAAGVAYDEPRTLPVDLLANAVPARRHRVVQRALGSTIGWETLDSEAAAARSPANAVVRVGESQPGEPLGGAYGAQAK